MSMSPMSSTPGKPKESKETIWQKVISSITKFIGRKQEKADALKSNTETTIVSSWVPQKKTPEIYNPLKWISLVYTWSSIQTVFPIIGMILVWILVFVLYQRPLRVIDLPKSVISQVVDDLDTSDIDFNKDELFSFVRNTMSNLHEYDFNGYYGQNSLKGLVNPEILQKSTAAYNQITGKLRNLRLIKHLMLDPQPIYYKDNVNQLFFVYVSGYMVINSIDVKLSGNGLKLLPYRAQLEIRAIPNIPGNRTGYYLLSLNEVRGQEDVKLFDDTRERIFKEKGIGR